MSYRDDKSIEQMHREKRALEDMLAHQISDAAGQEVRRVRGPTGPDWPVRSDYPNRAAYRQACAEWRNRP